MNDIIAFLNAFYPTSSWSLVGDSFNDLEWLEDSPAPTVEEFEAKVEEALVIEAFRVLRVERNKRLVDSDWTQVADAPVNQVGWAEYRRALRDLPENTVDPNNPSWPTPPE